MIRTKRETRAEMLGLMERDKKLDRTDGTEKNLILYKDQTKNLTINWNL